MSAGDAIEQFRCNICGAPCSVARERLTREEATCAGCGSTVRMRGIVYLLMKELFGKGMAIDEAPRSAQIAGIGLSDWEVYADRLAEKFDYANTYYHREPKLDITDLGGARGDRYDFLISTDVFEHVAPPVSRAFDNALALLKPGGVLIFSVPYGIGGETIEHFPRLHKYEIVPKHGWWGDPVLKNATKDGEHEVFEKLCFHGGGGSTLEMRLFSNVGLMGELERAGFEQITISDEAPEFGVRWLVPWSIPLTARKPLE